MTKIKITKALLDNYRKLVKEIPVLELELQLMKTTDAGLGNDTIFDYQTGYPRPQSVVGFDQQLYDRRRQVVDRKKDEAEAVKAWIDAIEDGQARCVFRMFYVEGMSWVKIADKTGYSKSPDYPRKMIRDPYLMQNNIR